MSNPFEVIDSRLSNIESLLLDIKHPERKIPGKRFLSVEGLSEYTGISEKAIRNFILEGKIESVKVNKVLIDESQFKEGFDEVRLIK